MHDGVCMGLYGRGTIGLHLSVRLSALYTDPLVVVSSYIF